MAISQCRIRESICTTCWGAEVSENVLSTGHGEPVEVLTKFRGVHLIHVASGKWKIQEGSDLLYKGTTHHTQRESQPVVNGPSDRAT